MRLDDRAVDEEQAVLALVRQDIEDRFPDRSGNSNSSQRMERLAEPDEICVSISC
jgi:hypothetical protein